MVKRFEVDECGGFYEDPTGEYVLHDEHAKALALIAEMKEAVFAAAGQYPHDSQAEFNACMALVARAEGLLRD